MQDPVISALSRADDIKLRSAIYNLQDSLKACSKQDLIELNKAGRLPDGCLGFVLTCRGMT